MSATRWRVTLGCALALAASAAPAHDTWFSPLPAGGRTGLHLALGTGDRFPRQEFAVGIEQLVASGCRHGSDAPVALKRLRDTPGALWLSAPTSRRRAQTCWAQLQPFDIELPPEKVRVYLDEISAPPALRDAWATLQQRGVPWRERYTKYARLEHSPSGRVAPITPVPMAMDVLMRTDGPLATGRAITFEVLRDGVPLAGLALELRSELSPLGIWRRTDALGRIEVAPPLPGRWVLRGTDLRLSATDPERWESRFVTLAFEVSPAAGEGRPAIARTARLAKAEDRLGAVASGRQ
jgi:hypothetical protein